MLQRRIAPTRLVELGQGPPPSVNSAPPTWREYFCYSADFVGAQALPAGTLDGLPSVQVFNDFAIAMHSDSDFELLRAIYLASNQKVYARIRDEASGRLLQRGTVDLRTVAGQGTTLGPIETTAFLPFDWPEPYVIGASSVLTVSAADASGAANAVRLTFHGNKIRPGRSPWLYNGDGSPKRYRAKVPYTYVLPPDGVSFVIAANATVLFSAPVDIEADFLALEVTAVHTGSATVLMLDGAGRERLWSDRAVEISNLFGNGQFPNVLPSPRFIPRGSSISATISDLSGAVNRVKLIIAGVKLYA